MASRTSRGELVAKRPAVDRPPVACLHRLFEAQAARRTGGDRAHVRGPSSVLWGPERPRRSPGSGPAGAGRGAGGARRLVRGAVVRPRDWHPRRPQSRRRVRAARPGLSARTPPAHPGRHPRPRHLDANAAPGTPVAGVRPRRAAGRRALDRGRGGRRISSRGRLAEEPRLHNLHLGFDRAAQGRGGDPCERLAPHVLDRTLVRVRFLRRMDPVPLVRLRFLRLGDLGCPRLRRAAGDRPLLGQPVSRGLPRPAHRRACDGPESNPVGIPPAHEGRRIRPGFRAS